MDAFYINPSTGLITTKKFLTEYDTKDYKVMSMYMMEGCICID